MKQKILILLLSTNLLNAASHLDASGKEEPISTPTQQPSSNNDDDGGDKKTPTPRALIRRNALHDGSDEQR